MTDANAPTIIKKYANRRLYDTQQSSYVTLKNLAEMVKKGVEFKVEDAKTGEDLTRSILNQIIFEQEAKTGNTLLPVSFLRQLISFYGDQMQMVVPSYLEHSMTALTEQQGKFKDQIGKAMEANPMMANMQVPLKMAEDQVRINTEMFQQAMAMFTPFGVSSKEEPANSESSKSDIAELKEQLRDLQGKIDKIS